MICLYQDPLRGVLAGLPHTTGLGFQTGHPDWRVLVHWGGARGVNVGIYGLHGATLRIVSFMTPEAGLPGYPRSTHPLQITHPNGSPRPFINGL